MSRRLCRMVVLGAWAGAASFAWLVFQAWLTPASISAWAQLALPGFCVSW